MDASSLTLLGFAASFLTGGAFGAILTELFRRRRARTRVLPLVELVNRNPLLFELKGTRLVRRQNDETVEVTNIRHYQLLLRNTTDIHLRGLQIQFEFKAAEDIVPWVSRPALGKAELVSLDPSPIQSPWSRAVRWNIPQFPPGDSVEFGFQIVNPSSDEYVAFLDSPQNVMLKITSPAEERPRFTLRAAEMFIAVTAAGALGVAMSSFLTSYIAVREAREISTATRFSVQVRERAETGGWQEVDTSKLKVLSTIEGNVTGSRFIYRARNDGGTPLGFVWTEPSSGTTLLTTTALAPGQEVRSEVFAKAPPVLGPSNIIVTDHPTTKARVVAFYPSASKTD
jgi:hypothetical protein